jgi:hypothetical protein
MMFIIITLVSSLAVALSALQCEVLGLTVHEPSTFIDPGAASIQWPVNRTVNVGCKQAKCLNGKQYTYCQYSKETAIVQGTRVLLNTFFYDGSTQGLCGYSYGFSESETTKSHIAALCA